MSAPLARPLADTLFIRDFAAFCRTKGDEGYNFWSTADTPQGCAFTQFVHSRGLTANTDPQWLDYHQRFDILALAKPWTFPALADRLERLIADAPVVVSK